MGEHWMFLTLCGFLLAGIVGITVWWTYGKLLILSAKYYRPSLSLPNSTVPAVPTVPTVPPPLLNSRARLAVPRLFRQSSFKKDEETGIVTETSYELLGRRND